MQSVALAILRQLEQTFRVSIFIVTDDDAPAVVMVARSEDGTERWRAEADDEYHLRFRLLGDQ